MIGSNPKVDLLLALNGKRQREKRIFFCGNTKSALLPEADTDLHEQIVMHIAMTLK